MIMIDFFVPLKKVPTTTHQMKKVNFKNKTIYEPEELKAARATLMAHVGQFSIQEPLTGPIRLTVKWLFPITKGRENGQYKTTRPDTDNLNKLLKDCMTELGFWKDDAQVASEIIEKFWAEKTGIYIRIEELNANDFYGAGL